jgi:hypothetical protein
MIINKQSEALVQCKIHIIWKFLLFSIDLINITITVFFFEFLSLEKYDSDKKIPVYGFGAKFYGTLSHCYPLNNNYENVCCQEYIF